MLSIFLPFLKQCIISKAWSSRKIWRFARKPANRFAESFEVAAEKRRPVVRRKEVPERVKGANSPLTSYEETASKVAVVSGRQCTQE